MDYLYGDATSTPMAWHQKVGRNYPQKGQILSWNCGDLWWFVAPRLEGFDKVVNVVQQLFELIKKLREGGEGNAWKMIFKDQQLQKVHWQFHVGTVFPFKPWIDPCSFFIGGDSSCSFWMEDSEETPHECLMLVRPEKQKEKFTVYVNFNLPRLWYVVFQSEVLFQPNTGYFITLCLKMMEHYILDL